MQTLVSIQIGRPQYFEADPSQPLSSQPWRTAIFKSPINGEVAVGANGVEGDGQADRRDHGGIDKAICVYPVQHLPYWQKQLDRTDFGNGAFGENFSVAGLDESSVAIGDRWQIGSATFEISQPRQPCWKLARRWQSKLITPQAIATGKTGWYLRVIQPGTVDRDDPIVVVDKPASDQARFTIARANEVFYQNPSDDEGIRQLLEVPQLSDAWRSFLQGKLKPN